MTNDSIFSLANIVAMVGWLLLALAPLRRGPMLLAARAVGGILAVAYTGFMLMTLSSGDPIDFTRLDGILAAFSNPSVMLVGWIHYLAFDLWVGAWEAEVAPKWGPEMTSPSRRDLVRDYKERKSVAGVYAVRCAPSGEVWTAGSRNIDA
eukprot:gene59175-78960_t